MCREPRLVIKAPNRLTERGELRPHPLRLHHCGCVTTHPQDVLHADVTSCRRLTSNRAPTVRSWGIHPRTGWQCRHPRFNARWLERGGRTHRTNASGRQIERRSSVLHGTIALALDHQGGDAYRDNDYEGIGEQRRNQPRLSFLTRTLLAMQHAWSPRLTLRRRRVGSHPGRRRNRMRRKGGVRVGYISRGLQGALGGATECTSGRPLERWRRLQLPDGRMAQDFEPVRRSRASMTVGQTSIS